MHLFTTASLAVAFAVGLVFTSATAGRDEPPAGSLQVMSYNIRYNNPRDGANAWPKRREALIKFLRETNPDILGLQEVQPDQLRELIKGLTGYGWYGMGRDDGHHGGEHVPVFYRADRFDRKQEGTFWLSDKPNSPGSRGWDAAIPRIVSWCVLFDKQADREIFVANTHFDHRGEQARAESAALVRRQLAKLAAGRPLVLTGDFNCLNNSLPYRTLIEPAAAPEDPPALSDARVKTKQPPAGPESTWNGFDKIVPGRIIDFVFVSADWRVARYRVLDPRQEQRFLSDHLPVLVQLEPAAKP